MHIAFHQQFKKLHDSFKVIREYYTQIVPEIDASIYVNSISSVMELVDLYSYKTELFRRDQRHVLKTCF
jgi:nucleoside-specific outer membrane channel protein Tsx